jgi:DNA-directed RNA polymerase beta subunit/intein/homing endonuclease
MSTKPSKLRVKKAVVENVGIPLPCPSSSSSSSLEKEIDAIHLKKSTLEVFKEFIPVVVGKEGEEERKLEKGGNEIEKTIKQIIQIEKQEKKQENEKNNNDKNRENDNSQGEPETKFGDESPEEEIKQGIFAEYPDFIQEAPIITDAYYKIQPLERLVRHQLESYNYFIHFQAHQTIQMFNPLVARIPEDLIPGTTDKYFLEIQVTVKNMRYQSPQIYETNGATKLLLPSEARLRNFTYASNTTVDLEIVSIERNAESEIVRTQNNVIPNVSITEMPIMVKSSLCMLTQNRHIGPEYTGECPMDCGGYFIIKGSEKAVLGQERAAENKIYCFDGKNTAKWQWVAEIKSVPDFKCVSPKQVEMMVSKKDNGYGYGIFVCIPKLKPNYSVELFVLFRALGVLSDKEICETILLNVEDEKQAEMLEFLHASVIDANRILTQEDAIRHLMSMVSYVPMMTTQNSSTFHSVGGGIGGGPSKKELASAIGGGGGGGALDIGGTGIQGMDEEKRKEWAAYGFRKKHEFTTELLNNDLFPHCRTTKQKIYMLGYMAQRLIYIGKGWSKADNRDSYLNKRIDLPGISLNNLFRNYYHRMTKDMIKAVNKEIKQGTWRSHDDVANIINKSNIYKIVKPATIKTGMIRALATGDFSTKQANSNKVGVAQVLNRLTYQATLSHLRRINTPVDKSSEMIDPRKLHGTQWGFLCLTGDVDVLLANGLDSKKICDIRDGDWVTTVNRETLEDQPSDMFRKFGKMPDKLYEILTVSGRKIKATADHPFLIQDSGGSGKYVMKKVGELDVAHDNLVIRHTVLPVLDSVRTAHEPVMSVCIKETEVLEQYRVELLELHLIGVEIPVSKLKLVARLIAALNTDGHLGVSENEYYSSAFNVGEKNDVYQLADDIRGLGFTGVSIRRRITKFEDKVKSRTTTSSTWEVSKNGAFSYFMYLMGGLVGKKTAIKRRIPDWLMLSGESVKREFLSGFQGGDGCRLSYQRNLSKSKSMAPESKSNEIVRYKPNLGITYQTTTNEFLEDTLEYMKQIMSMFRELGIECSLKQSKLEDTKTKVGIVFEATTKNLVRYADVIQYTYCEEKRRTSAPVIEHLKIREFHKKQRDDKIQMILENMGKKEEDRQTAEQMSILTQIPVSQIRKIQRKKKADKDVFNGRFTTDVLYEDFIRDHVLENGCVSIGILSITEIAPEMVYDFTTQSENHSFVASSFVVSNCPIETPEGSSIGLVKNLSSHTHITIPGNSSSLYEYVRPYVTLVEDAVTPRELYGKAKVFINGVWMGVVKSSTEGGRPEMDAIALYKSLKDKKSKGIINIYTSIYFDYIWGEIRLCNDGGRLTRPVLRVRDGKVLITPEIVRKLDIGELSWNDLLTNCKLEESVVEYIDPEEQYYSMITMHPSFLSKQMGGILAMGKEGGIMGREDSKIYDQKKEREREIDTIRNERFITACEIHPQTLLGILASCIPFPEHNPAARDIYQTAMAKQAMGFGALNYDQRMEKTAYVLNSPTRPLVDTRLMNSIHLDRMPAGCQVHVAIMTYTGYNQEDSIILNEGAIKRGLFSTTVYHTEKDEDNNVVRDEIIRSKPNPEETKGMKFANYEKLGKNGFVPPNTKLENRDVLIAKVFPIKENRADSSKKIKYEDQSKVFRSTEPAYVDRNLTGRNGDGANFGKTTIRIYRPPVIGDKFASRSAQKGTTGLIIPEADMPFTREGVKPDIILNPHAIPSRMTISHIKETLLGKVLIELGMFGDGTAFSGLDVGTICSALQDLGYESHGNEVLYDGLTGEQIETSIFLGPVFYQRLKHMVNDKQHSRSVGVVVNFTRQPAEGRSREGGFRVGEMEKDVLVAHGGSKFFRERMYDMSDKYGLYVCKGCGMYGAVNEGEGPWNRGALGSKANPDFKQYLCKTCDNRSDFSYVEVPYCFKLLQQELQAMNVGMRLITE